MQRLVLLLALVFLAVAGGWSLWQLRASDRTVPMVALLPSTPVRATTTPEDGAVAAQGGVSTRTVVPRPPTPTDDRVAVLEVLVQSRVGAAPPTPAPYRDVDLLVEAPSPELVVRQRVSTDPRGIARFEVRGGHRRTARITASQTAQATVELRADEPLRVSITITTRVQVEGRVVDQSGNGVADADLVLLPWVDPEAGTPRLRRVGKSAADGAFAVALGAGGRLGAEHTGFAPSAMFAIPPPTDPTEPPVAHTLELTLISQFATVVANVRGANGATVPRAEIEIRAVGAPPSGAVLAAPPRRATTDDGGRVRIDQLRPGRFEFAVRAAGHATTRGAGEAKAALVTELDIRLPTSCAVHGFVQLADGTRVADARVWSGAADDFDAQVAITDHEGAFRLLDLPAGRIQLTAREGAGVLAPVGTPRARTQLDVAPGVVGHWVAVLETGAESGALPGTIVDTDGRPLPGWRVAVRSGGKTVNTSTDDRGSFRTSRPGPGAIDVLVYAPDVPVGAFATAVQLSIDPDAGPLRVVVDRRAPTTTIVGRVQAVDQSPLAATVTCYHHERRETARFVAARDGALQVRAVPPGTIDVYVEHPSRAPAARKRLTARPPLPLDLGVIVLGDAAALHGSVTGPAGVIPEQVELTLQTKEQRIVGEYAAGAYRFPAVPPGQHVLMVQGMGIAAANFAVELTAGVDREQAIELRAGVPRTIVVPAPDAAGPTVSLALRVPGSAHAWLGVAQVQRDANSTNAAARFVAWMAPGTYEAIAWSAGWEGRAQVLFTADDDSVVSVALHPN